MNNQLDGLRVRDIGEQGLLRKLQAFCPAEIVGDDAALLPVDGEQSLVVTSDVLVDGVHFSIGLASPDVHTTSPTDVGWRAAAANLSDLAAMGATPLGITVGLSLPGDLPVAWVEQIYEGLVACLQPYQTPIVGGDICRSPILTVAIAAFGQVSPNRTIRRSTATPGDVILVTGVHGASKAGLEILLNPASATGLREGDRAPLIRAHQRPQPRLDVICLLGQVSQSPWRIAGMDSSDGLADAIVQLCRSSQRGARIQRDQIPMPDVFHTWLTPDRALEWALYGGEDFELVLALPEAIAQEMVQRLGNGAAIVGVMTPNPEVILYDHTGTHPEQMLNLSLGFQHF